MVEERLLEPALISADNEVEEGLRPKQLVNYVGQRKAVANLKV
ncbi:MAG: Holliday junction branch migration DNA helicase RuvB, partial [Deltaproteobacteria bacterium]|nr:Holliday junction branch migration DNA helicase RuvB [Deltaproteobacteria bacterium]